MEKTSIKDVLKAIEDQSEFHFFYSNEVMESTNSISLDVEELSISGVLDQLFSNMDISYRILENNLIVVVPNNKLHQQMVISGIVVDASNNDPLPGVYVLIEGMSTGTVTDSDGKYSIEVPDEKAKLVFSYVGYITETISIVGNSVLNVSMIPDIQSLEEVVVVGYGIQKKASVTGAISTVKGDDLQKVPTNNLTSTLTGRMTGVIVNTRGASPGDEDISINIRGKSSWQSGSPLIIIDGIANRSGYEKLNPKDIESISVLKDASAAIYGSRAANGVILITTKRGIEGKPTIEYSGDFGFTKPTRVPDMARSWQYAQYYTEANRSGYTWTEEEINNFKQGTNVNLYPNYNLEDYVLQKVAPQHTHTVSVRGGGDAVKYYVSGRYLYQDSYYKDGIDDFHGYSVRSNIDATIQKNLTLSLDLSGRRDDIRRAVGSDDDSGFFEEMLGTDPTKPIFYENGLPAPIYDKNIVELIKGKGGQKDERKAIINSQLKAKWNLPFITKGLFVEATGAYDYSNVQVKQFSKSYDIYTYDNSTGTYSNNNTNPVMNRGLYDYFYNSYRYTLNGKLGYERTFNDHSINAFIAYEQYSINYLWISATRSTFLSANIPYQFAGDATTQKNDGSGYEYAYRNFFGRLAYSFKEKYLLDFTLRRDESLKFPENGRVGVFPGISLGWRLSEEPFVKENLSLLDNLKLRASYGQMGSDNVDDYQYLATASLQSSSNSYVLGTDPAIVSTLYFSGTPNPNITWEVANTYNLALEGAMWQGLLGFELEYFYSKRSNILATRDASVPTYAGMDLPDENIGKAQNQGIELMLSHRKKVGNFHYMVSGNFTYMANKIIYMDESPNVPDYQRREGHPIDSWLLYKTDGIFNTPEELEATAVKRPGAQVGDIKYVNANDDNVIDNNDRVRLYDSNLPKIVYGLNIDVTYKNIQLNMLWQGQAKVKTYINPTVRNGDINIPLWMYNNRWTAENAENATMPRAFYHRSDTYNTLASDFWLRDASFLRLKSLEIGYNLPKNLISKVALSRARIYVSGYNLLLIDKVKDYDPEVVNELGVFYPATKVYNMGINLTF